LFCAAAQSAAGPQGTLWDFADESETPFPGDILNGDHRLNGDQSGKGARFLGTHARERSDDAQAAFLTFGRFVDTQTLLTRTTVNQAA
jgi:hypothetical protein